MEVKWGFIIGPRTSAFQTENICSIVSPLGIISFVIAENTQVSIDKQNLTQLSTDLGSKNHHSLFTR